MTAFLLPFPSENYFFYLSMDFVSIVDPRVLAIPIVECNEPMVDSKTMGTIRYGPSPEIEDNPCYTFVRKSVYEKLLLANDYLAANELTLCLYEGWRSLSLQEELFNKYYKIINTKFPDASTTTLFEKTVRLVSPIVNYDGTPNIPPHSTGGAVDVYVVTIETNTIVPMGIHPKDWHTDTEGIVSATKTTHISYEERKNRKLLCNAMIAAGFVNYDGEYWHWSYGDRYWAYKSGIKEAKYGNSIK